MAFLARLRCSLPNAAYLITQLKFLLMFFACGVFFTFLGILTGHFLTTFSLLTTSPELQQANISFRDFPAFKEGLTSVQSSTDRPTGERGLRMLVMSSVGRSGSSFLGQLVAQLPSTNYVFEPLHFLQEHSAEGVTSENSRALLRAIFECHFSRDWLRFALERKSISAKECRGDTAAYRDCITKLCLRRRNRLMKVIRFRVSWAKELLNQDASLKVIHIVRDPRGSFKSLKTLHMVQKNYSDWCPKIQEDLELGASVSASFPKSFMSIKYEDLCYDPIGMSLKIWKFLSGRNASFLPDTWTDYLKEHTKIPIKGQFTTKRDSRKEAEAWRQEIDGHTLMEVERDCEKVLELLEYNKFGSLIHARNMSLPLRRSDEIQ